MHSRGNDAARFTAAHLDRSILIVDVFSRPTHAEGLAVASLRLCLGISGMNGIGMQVGIIMGHWVDPKN
jgi:hypothetical protein